MRSLLLTLAPALLLLLGADALLPGAAAAQTPAPSETPAEAADDGDVRRFSISGAFAGSLVGPGNALGDLMTERGFDDTETFFCFLFCVGPQERPEVTEFGSTLVFSARYRFSRRWSAAAFYNGGGEEVTARGFRSPGYSVRLTTSASTFALAMGYRPLQGVDFGAGPAIYRVTLHRAPSGSSRTETATRIGLLADVGIELPAESRFFARIFTQYRWMPATEFGPLTVNDGSFEGGPSVTFDSFDVPASHLVLGVGAGIRF